MKIGKFAEENSLSIETIRHYMDLGLIIPEKKGGHYEFDVRCLKDLQDILYFKKMGFTLMEIKALFMYKRLGKLTPYQEDEYYIEWFRNKYRNISGQIEELTEMKKRLKNNLKELDAKETKKNFMMGVDIKALSLLFCPNCEEELKLFDGQIDNNQIINGRLRCSCGTEYVIEDGIILGNNRLNEDENIFLDNYIGEYINETSPEYIDNIYDGLEWIYKRLNFDSMKNKVILELGSGMGVLLRHIYNDLPDDTLYIAVDYDLRRHKFLKNILERADIKKNILFVCEDFLQIPLKKSSVDILIDATGTSNYSFEHEDFALELIDHYVKEKAILMGSYIIFKKFSIDSLIKEQYRKNFKISYIQNEINKLNYKVADEKTSNILGYAGKYENYFTEGEKVYTYIFYGER